MQRPLPPSPAARRWCEMIEQTRCHRRLDRRSSTPRLLDRSRMSRILDPRFRGDDKESRVTGSKPMFDLKELERAHEIVGQAVPPTPAHAWPLLAERLGACRRQAREPHADRRLQGARRAGLSRPAEARAAECAADRSRRPPAITARASRSRHAVTACPRRSMCRPGNSVEKNAAMRAFGAEAGRAWRRFPGRRARKRCAARSSTACDIGAVVPSRPGSGGSDLCARTAPDGVRSRRALRSDRAGLGHLRLHHGARSARPEDRDRRRAVDRGAVLCALVRGRQGRDHRTPATRARTAWRRAVPDAEAVAIILKGASRIVQVSDDEIGAAIRAYWTDTHNLAEGAGAAPLAAALQEKERSARQARRSDPDRRQYRFRPVPEMGCERMARRRASRAIA